MYSAGRVEGSKLLEVAFRRLPEAGLTSEGIAAIKEPCHLEQGHSRERKEETRNTAGGSVMRRLGGLGLGVEEAGPTLGKTSLPGADAPIRSHPPSHHKYFRSGCSCRFSHKTNKNHRTLRLFTSHASFPPFRKQNGQLIPLPLPSTAWRNEKPDIQQSYR